MMALLPASKVYYHGETFPPFEYVRCGLPPDSRHTFSSVNGPRPLVLSFFPVPFTGLLSPLVLARDPGSPST